LGFDRAGFAVAWQVEIDQTCRRVLARHWPEVPRFSDIRLAQRNYLFPVDVLIGGFPCQDLSVAGARVGLSGSRSGLWWEMLDVVANVRPRFLCFENVPGLLSSFTARSQLPADAVEGSEWEVDEDSDYETVLASLAQLGYFGSWRVLDAQHFDVPQRRQRVFGLFATARYRAGDGGRLVEPQPGEDIAGLVGLCEEVLALPYGEGWHPAAGGRSWPEVAGTLAGGTGKQGYRIGAEEAASQLVAFGGNDTRGQRRVAAAVNAKGGAGRMDFETETFIVNSAGSLAKENHARPADVARCLDSSIDSFGGQGGTVVVNAITKNYGDGSFRSDPRRRRSVPRLQRRPDGDAAERQRQRGRRRTHRRLLLQGRRPGRRAAGPDTPGDGTQRVARERGRATGGRHAHHSNRASGPAHRPTTRRLASGSASRAIRCTRLAPTAHAVAMTGPMVRRLTPTECERLQGWPDGWTEFDHKGRRLKDGPRYKMIGNGVAEPCARWIAMRLREIIFKR
jgi:site-specific DNA-cytosine methylase